ncbi:hypothetical protein I7I50_08337 [Histoplasma capsulatum G186AR]|uniref:Uncharacterized protein n=1 Tax=Ajellomyces capsulatus TaxID=5037 RepID=A0A8H7YND4_AJECA|nr:hypothetical protein I7I52_05853 [Histoplasma capsulatum]QSS73536.1 hypothetical protein I7I50_08337 [Histoplasma capsulatum G186AR]
MHSPAHKPESSSHPRFNPHRSITFLNSDLQLSEAFATRSSVYYSNSILLSAGSYTTHKLPRERLGTYN